MVTIGWLADKPNFTGGAEISGKALMDAAPDWAQIVQCPPDRRPPPVDAFIVQNCLSYTERWIGELSKKPVIKQMRDRWHWGAPVLRRWLLDESQLLIFSSPSHVEHFPYSIGRPLEFIPPPIDIERFLQAAIRSKARQGNIWIGRIHPAKGISPAIDWAIRNGETLDFYGYFGYDGGLPFNIPGFAYYRGKYTQDELPDLLARHERFVFMPLEPESFSRTTVEAWASGCEMILDGEIGALWWLENRPDDLGRGVELFWKVIEDALAPFA